MVAAVAGRATVFVDGGFRGTDVVKAIAAGAQLRRPRAAGVLGLAAAGARVWSGPSSCSRTMRIALGLLGVTRLAELDRSYLHAASPVARAT